MTRLWALTIMVSTDMPATADEDARLTAFFRKYLDEEFRHRPLEATRLGDRRFDHLLDDLSGKARAANTERTRKTLEELPKQVDHDKLSAGGRLDFEILRHHLKRSLWLDENFDPFVTDPRTYSEYISDSIYLLFSQSTLPKERTIDHCIQRMALVPRIVEQARANVKNPAKVFVETALRQNLGAIRFYESGLFDLAGDTPRKDELKQAAARIVPVLKDYQKFLEDELLPAAKGEWRIGKEKFARKLELELDAGLSAEEVHREAESEMARVLRDMYVIARQLWGQAYPRQPLPADDAKGRAETIRRVLEHFNKEHGKAE